MNRSKKIPALFSEQSALGELSPERERELDPALLAEQKAAIESSNREILQSHPSAPMAAAIRLRAEQRKHSAVAGKRILVWASAASVAVLCLIAWALWSPMLAPVVEETALLRTPETVRMKGSAQLIIHRQTAGGAEVLLPGAVVRPGDRLQLSYLARGAGHGIILSLDGRGQVSLHFPKNPTASTALAQEGEQNLPFSYQLDDAPGFERFVLVTAEKAIPVAGVLAKARALGADERIPLNLPVGCRQVDFLLQKADAPKATPAIKWRPKP